MPDPKGASGSQTRIGHSGGEFERPGVAPQGYSRDEADPGLIELKRGRIRILVLDGLRRRAR